MAPQHAYMCDIACMNVMQTDSCEYQACNLLKLSLFVDGMCYAMCLQLLQKLQVLDLTNCTGLDADTLEQLVKLCGRLQQITLPQLARGWGGSEHDLLEPLG